LLNKLLIEQTKSRPRHSKDNGLVEAKNGAVVRKHMGYLHIAAPHAAAIGKSAALRYHRYTRCCFPLRLTTNSATAHGR
jgi:hypothetical protein